MKKMLLIKLSWMENVFLYKAVLLQIGADEQKEQYGLNCNLHSETMRYFDSLHYERVFVYRSSSSAKGFHFTGKCRYT